MGYDMDKYIELLSDSYGFKDLLLEYFNVVRQFNIHKVVPINGMHLHCVDEGDGDILVKTLRFNLSECITKDTTCNDANRHIDFPV